MNVVGLDLNATRARAVHGRVPMPLLEVSIVEGAAPLAR